MMTDRMISVVVACYRDEGSVQAMYERLTKVLSSITDKYEIIYVNDASPDRAEEVLREIAARDPRLTVVIHSRNFGSQNAFTSGMAQALGDAVVLMDGDLQDPPEIIPKLVERWIEGHEVVYGVRVKRRESAFRQIAYKLFYRIFRFFSYLDIPLDAGDFSLIDRKIVNLLLGMPERQRFLRGMRVWLGFRQIGVPYERAARHAGESTNSLRDNFRWAKLGIFSFSYVPLEMITTMALFMVVLSLLAIVVYLILFMLSPGHPPTGFMTVLILILFIGGIQLLSLGMIAEYLGQVFTEIKGRPQYVTREIINDHRAAEESDGTTETE